MKSSTIRRARQNRKQGNAVLISDSFTGTPKIPLEMKTAGFCAIQNPAEQIFKNIRSLLDDSHFQTTFDHLSII